MHRFALGLFLVAACAAASCASRSRPAASTNVTAASVRAPDPLPLWNDGPTKRAVASYVMRATSDGPGHVAPADRIAVFDDDGTLGKERPFSRVYTPMMELLRFLERRGFATYLVVSGDLEFMRNFAAEVYGIRAERVVDDVRAIGKTPAFIAQSLRSSREPAALRADQTFSLVIHHDDAARDLAYEDAGADLATAARAAGAVVVSTKDDWGRIYGPR